MPDNEDEACCDFHIVGLRVPPTSRFTGAQRKSLPTVRHLRRRCHVARGDFGTSRADQDKSPCPAATARRMENCDCNQFADATGEPARDSAGRMLYRAYSVALVQLLLDEGGGRGHLARYISNLSHGSNDRVADLKACFPQLRDDVEKKWRSRVARLSEHQTYQLLSFAESEQRLDELIQIKISDGSRNRGRPKPANLSELSRSKLSAEGKAAVNHMSQGLLLLVGTAHPVLRPVAREYQQIAALLIRGKRRGIAKRVSHLDGIRKELAARMGDIDDYMNWFEATQMENQSGAFSDYLKAANQSQVSAQRRRDPLSVYLDALEDQIETSELE